MMARLVRCDEQSDGELIAAAQADDMAAFEELYDRYSEPALRIAATICHDVNRAEDVVQEAFLSVWRSRATYRPGLGTFRTWSMRIVKHRAIDSHRAASIRPPQRRGEPDEDRDVIQVSFMPPTDAIARGDGESLRTSLGLLPEAQSEVIKLAFYGELSHSEIAIHLNLPSGTVKGRMRLGLEKLRYEMARSGVGRGD